METPPKSDAERISAQLSEIQARLSRVEDKLGLAPLPAPASTEPTSVTASTSQQPEPARTEAEPLPASTVPATTETETVPPPPATEPAAPQTVSTTTPVSTTASEPSSPLPPTPATETRQPAPRGQRANSGELEKKIGTYWLSRIGIGFVVIGAAFFLAHAYQSFGPAAKLSMGILAAFTMLAGGEFFARKEPFKWLGMGLTGGGWALTYFCIYAAQNVAGVKVMDSPVLNASLLLATSAGCMLHALKRKSQAIALLSTLLAFGTISLSPVTGFSLISTGILLAGLSAVIVKTRWHGVLVASAIGTYSTFFLYTQPQIHASVTTGAYWLAFGFLVLFWGVYNSVLYLLARKDQSLALTSTQAGVVLLNAGAFVVNVMALGALHPEWRYLFCLALGAGQIGFSLLSHRSAQKELGILHSMIGLTLITAAVALKFDAQTITCFWLLETALLVWAGLRFNLTRLRVFAGGLGILALSRVFFLDFAGPSQLVTFGIHYSSAVLVGITAALSLAFMAWNYSRSQFEARLTAWEKLGGFDVCAIASALTLFALTGLEAPLSVLFVWWTLGALAFLALATQRRSLNLHIATAVGFFGAAVALISGASQAPLLAVLLTLPLFFGTALLYRRGLNGIPESARLKTYYGFWLASMLLSVIITPILTKGTSTAVLPWSAETVLFVGFGFLFQDRTMRVLSLLGFVPIGLILFNTTWTWALVLPAVAALFLLGFAFRFLPDSDQGAAVNLGGPLAEAHNQGLAWSRRLLLTGSVLLAIGFFNLCDWQTLAFAWGIEGLSLVVLGFVFWEKSLRITALTILSLLAAKLLLYDLSGADTGQRIISFIVAGVVLILSSYVYGWFSKRFEERLAQRIVPPADKDQPSKED